MDIGLLALRILLAAILFAHGTQKAFGWFHGPGPRGAEALFDKLGQRPARAKVRVAIVCELTAAALLALGVATPLGVAIAAGTMVVAGSAMTLLNRSFWNAAGGGEYPFVLAAMALCLGATGPGKHSIDAALDVAPTDTSTQILTVVAVLVVVAITATPVVLATRRVQADRTPALLADDRDVASYKETP